MIGVIGQIPEKELVFSLILSNSEPSQFREFPAKLYKHSPVIALRIAEQ